MGSEVDNVILVIARSGAAEAQEWKLYLINNNDLPLENTLIVSKGHAEQGDAPQGTSVLRHFLETVRPHGFALVEPIDPDTFGLTNEYWISYYIGKKVYDKRFIFTPGTATEKNLTFIAELGMEGVLWS